MAFIEPIAKGTGLDDGDPRLALRNTIIQARLRTPGGRAPDQIWVYCLIVNCWNAWALGRPLQHARAQSSREGKMSPADIIGAPKFAAGVEALTNYRVTAKAARLIAAHDQPVEAVA